MLPAETYIDQLHLRVRNLASLRPFYEQILGFRSLSSSATEVILSPGPEGTSHVVLEQDAHARVRNPASPGLFHVAFLFPARKALATAFRRLVHAGYPLQGFADHGVSEAVYLADPEGNGIELYCDRPRELWKREAGMIAMVTEPLDVEQLYRDGDDRDQEAQAAIGHMHLQVSHLETAEAFYHSTLGFSVTQRSYPGALFLAAGDYHHHIGLNTWNSRRSHPEEGTTGLTSFGIAVPNDDVRGALEARSRGGRPNGAGRLVLSDEDHIQVSIGIAPEVPSTTK